MHNRILVTGKKGQLGQSLQKVLKDFPKYFNLTFNNNNSVEDYVHENLDLIFVTHNELDLSNPDLIDNFFLNENFSSIINCAAYTSVDKAESNLELANKINHLAVEQLSKIAKKKSIPLIHISTDYVFNGQSTKPYCETDDTDPQNIYGNTKLKGEIAMIKSGCTGAIIRTSWVYSEFGSNFLKKMLALGTTNNTINVVADQFGNPTYATNLAKIILTLFYKKQSIDVLTSQLNIYHFSDEGICSWYDFAKAIFKLSNINCKVNPVETKDYPTISNRPHYSAMDKSKIKHHLPGLVIQHWRNALISCLADLKKIEF